MKNGNKEYFNLILREQSVALNNAITTEKKHMNAMANNTDFVNTTGFPSTYLCWSKFIRLKKIRTSSAKPNERKHGEYLHMQKKGYLY